jgi:serine/threonine protein kinase
MTREDKSNRKEKATKTPSLEDEFGKTGSKEEDAKNYNSEETSRPAPHMTSHSIPVLACTRMATTEEKLLILKERKDMMWKTRVSAVREIETNEGAKVIASDKELSPYFIDYSTVVSKGKFGSTYVGQDHVGHESHVKVYDLKKLDFQLAFRVKKSVNHLRYLSHHKSIWILHISQVMMCPDKVYVFMDKTLGQNLHQRLHECSSLSHSECLAIGKDLARGLSFLHERGIAHDDFCAKHIFFDRRGCPVISGLDYSVVYWDNNGGDGSKGKVIQQQASSKDYFVSHWPPEKIKDDLYDPSKADVWSFGVVFLQMLTTEDKPFHPKSPHRLDVQWKTCFDKNRVHLTPNVSKVLHLTFVTDPELRGDILDVLFSLDLHDGENSHNCTFVHS